MKAYRLQQPVITEGLFRGTQTFEGGVVFNAPVTLGSLTVKQVVSQNGTVDNGLITVACDGDIQPADHRNVNHADRILGVSLGSGLIAIGGEFMVNTTADIGTILFAGESGLLADQPPASGFQQQVAVMVEPQKAVLAIRAAIILA